MRRLDVAIWIASQGWADENEPEGTGPEYRRCMPSSTSGTLADAVNVVSGGVPAHHASSASTTVAASATNALRRGTPGNTAPRIRPMADTPPLSCDRRTT